MSFLILSKIFHPGEMWSGLLRGIVYSSVLSV